MSLPSLNALYTFATVARLGSITAAADELFVTPSAVSRQIKHLEREISGTIIERNGRGVRVTALGRRLWMGIDPAFGLISATVERTFRYPDRNVITLHVPPVFGMRWLLPRLGRFNRSMSPCPTVMIYDMPSPFSRGLLQKEKFDTSLVIDWGQFERNPNAEKLVDEAIFPVCSPTIAGHGSLAGLTLLHHETLPDSWSWPVDWPTFVEVSGLAGIDTTPGPHFSEQLILNAACEGLGVAIANTTLVHDDLVAGRLIRPVAESMKSDHAYYLLIPKSMRTLPEVRAFRAWLLDEIAKCFAPHPLPSPTSAAGRTRAQTRRKP